MARIVVVSFVSLDGVVQSPLSPDEDRDGGFDHGGWVTSYGDEVVDSFMEQTTVGASGLLLGRRTYDLFVDAWSGADETDPAVAAMNRVPKLVVTSSADGLVWQGSVHLGSDVPAAVAAATDLVDGDLVVLGSPTLVRALAEHDLVDEYRLLVFPVVLGPGKRLFGDSSRPAGLALVDSTVTPRGVVISTYARDASQPMLSVSDTMIPSGPRT